MYEEKKLRAEVERGQDLFVDWRGEIHHGAQFSSGSKWEAGDTSGEVRGEGKGWDGLRRNLRNSALDKSELLPR